MATWRDADDPRCPECGEPIGATATYCMHCSAELPMDDSADVTDADDVSYGAGPGPSVGSGTTDSGEGGLRATLRSLVTFNRTRSPTSADVDEAVGTVEPGTGESDQAAGEATTGEGAGDASGDLASAQLGDRSASLALRAPTAFVVSLPIAFALLFIVLPSIGQLSGSLAGLVWLAAWVGSIGYLVQKPLPSDIIGDAFFVYAGILLVVPLLIGASLLSTMLLQPGSTDNTLGDIVLMVVIMEFTFAFPAAFLAVIGAIGNWWAKNKLSPD